MTWGRGSLVPLAAPARCCRLLMQFVFPFQLRDTLAARASRLPWTISILSTPLGKYPGKHGDFPFCPLQRGQGLELEQRARERRRRRRCRGSARLAGQPGTEAAALLSALIYLPSARLGSSCCAGFPVFPPAPAPPWLCSGSSSDLVLWKAGILQAVPLERPCVWQRHRGAHPPSGCS